MDKLTKEKKKKRKISDLLVKISLQASLYEFVWEVLQLPFLTLTEKVNRSLVT